MNGRKANSIHFNSVVIVLHNKKVVDKILFALCDFSETIIRNENNTEQIQCCCCYCFW